MGPDQALVIEGNLPSCVYAGVVLWNRYMQSYDYRYRNAALNRAQMTLGDGDAYRVVVAHRAPGVPNWLDTGGESEGMIQYRWIWTKNDPVPVLSRVPAADVRAALPADTPVVTPEQRRAQVYVRQEHVRRRFRL